jgi:ResB-like family.
LLKRVRAFADPEKTPVAGTTAEARGTGDPQQLFMALRMGKPAERKTGDGRKLLFAAANRPVSGDLGLPSGNPAVNPGFCAGADDCGNYTVYAMPGETKPLDNTGLTVRVDDFQTERTADGSASQYTAWLTVTDPETKAVQSGTASVNRPASLRL